MTISIPSGVSIFIIDTEQDAGRFANEMCAYITGKVGEQGLGNDYAELYEQETGENPLEAVSEVLDERNRMSPCSIWPTPGWFSNGLGGVFQNGQEEQALADYKSRIEREMTCLIRQKEIILDEIRMGKTSVWTQDKLQKEIAQHQNKIFETQALTHIVVYPAYLSLGIFLQASDDILLDTMKARAFAFLDKRLSFEQKHVDSINITGFRLLQVRCGRNQG